MPGMKPLTIMIAAALTLPSIASPSLAADTQAASAVLYRDDGSGADWPGYGRTFGEQHYSPLDEVNAGNVGRLGLAWSLDLPAGNPISQPVAVDGIVYVATGYSIVRAIDATTGKQLWLYDPKVADTEAARIKLRNGWGIRGLAWWNGKLYVGTHDGRLIAIDAKTGKPVWSVMTMGKDDVRFISGAPRVFDGKVIIGHGGADIGVTRGYVTTYDAETGKLLWRFYTVPGNPALGFEDKAQEMAAKTWTGEWWKFGGGGTVWNAMTYDHETDTIFLGTGNGGPWNQKIRSPGGGDNLFLCSIVALDAKTGAYKWHYQINPGETWDYNATMDMPLATLMIDGKPRKVIMEAPKNGFFYVIDRLTGKLISAEPFVKVTWASKIDLETGRPVENPHARYPNGETFEMWPSTEGGHNWLPMSFSPKTGLVYIPSLSTPATFSDKGIDLKDWRWQPGGINENGVVVKVDATQPGTGESALLAWNPATQKPVWRVPTTGLWSGGAMATGGNLVFQGELDGTFSAYDATTGKRLWHYDTKSPALAPPVTYEVGGHQYVTVLTGAGLSGAIFGPAAARLGWDWHTQPRRVLTFRLDANGTLPPRPPHYTAQPIDDPTYKADPTLAAEGGKVYHQQCFVCHGAMVEAGGMAPDLRASPVPQSADAFTQIVHGGALMQGGMPRFDQLTDHQLDALRQYIRSRARDLAVGE